MDDQEYLTGMVSVLGELLMTVPVVFSMNQRMRQRMETASSQAERMPLPPALSYLGFWHPASEAWLVLADCGGMQEGVTVLRVPYLTFQENRGRLVKIIHGSNRFASSDSVKILKQVRSALAGLARVT